MATSTEPAQIGVMVDGSEASWVGYPAASDLDYLKSHGVDLIRLPIAWELMQNTLNGPLNQTYLAGLETFLSQAAARDMEVIVELHNFGGYTTNWQQVAASNWGNFAPGGSPQMIGSSAVPISSFVNFWTKLSTALKDDAGLAGYDIMNEPHDISNSTWQTAAQSAVNAIRAVDTQTTIYVEGNNWSNASVWNLPWYNLNLNVVDPANNLVYEAHQYFDNGTGLYTEPYDPATDYTNMGVDLLQPWVNWLQANNAQGFLGEFGIAVDDARWLPVLDAFMDALQANNIPGTYCNYMYNSSISPSWGIPSGGIAIAPAIGQGAAIMELIFEHSAPEIAGFVPTNGTGNNGSTTANILTLTGTGASYCTVKVYDQGTLIGTTTSNNITGAWSLTTGTLANGAHNFTATNIDAAGTSSQSSFALAVTVGSTASVIPTITSFSTDSGTVGDGITSDNTLALTGTAAANSTVKVYDGATLLGSATANGSGAWSYTTAALSNGAHSLTATATDAAGNTSAASACMSVTVDTVAPSAPAISSFSNDTGTVGDGVTSDNTLALTGTAAANSTVKVYDGATLLGSATANGSGAWSYTTGTLSNATHSFTAKATDAAGNTSAASAAMAVTVQCDRS